MAVLNKIKVDTEISVATVRPGDKLLVGVPEDLPAEELDNRIRNLTELLPGVDIIMIESTGMMVYRAEAEDG